MSTQRIPLTQPIETRDGTLAKDSRSTNCVFETRDQKREFVKRPGLINIKQIAAVTPPASLLSQGMYGFNNKLVSVIANTVYSYDPISTLQTTVGAMSATTSFSYYTKTTLDSYLFLHNKTNAYVLTSAMAYGAVTNDSIINITVDSAGSNYSSGATISFSYGTATALPVIDSITAGAISSVNVTGGGTGYTYVPTITITVAPTTTATGTSDVPTNSRAFIQSSFDTPPFLGMVASGTGITVGSKVVAVDVYSVGSYIITLDTNKTSAISGTITYTDTGAGALLSCTINALPAGPYVAGAVFLDGYVFLGCANNRIYNSTLGDPRGWSALDYLTFEQTADTLVAICKHLNYLVAFGKFSTQFYYDAGNATGSPLAIAQSYTMEIGCATGDSVVSTDNTVIWIGHTKTQGRSVYLMDGVSPIKVSTNSIDKILDLDDLGKVTSFCYKYSGHTLYILTLHNASVTLVYDINEKMWYQWTKYAMVSTGEAGAGTYQETYFRPCFYAQVNNVPYVLDDDTAVVYELSPTTYQDDGQDIYCRTITDMSDNGTTKRKFYGRLEIIGDKVGGTMQVRHTGNDYQTWSTYRTIDLSASRSQIYLSGADRRRAWEFLVTSNVPLRLDGAEVDFRLGELDQEQNIGGSNYRR